MRRLLPFLALLLACVPAEATITVPQSGSATANTATISSTQFGDLIIVCGNRASNTEPTVPTGYTTIKHATGANTQSGTCAYKISTGGETSTPAMTNATNVAYMVARGYRMSSTGPIGLNPAQSNGSSTSLTYPTGTMQKTDGSSMLVTFGTATGATGTTPDVCPTGPGTMTLASTTSQSSLALCYLVGATSASTINSVTIAPTTGYCGFTFEILGNEPLSGVSSYIVDQNYSTVSNEACTGACNLTIPVTLNGGTLANNEINVVFHVGYASTVPSVSNIYANADTGHATWTFSLAQSINDAGETSKMYAYHIDGAAGITSITVVFSSVFNSAWIYYNEMRQIATSSAINVSTSQVSSATPPFYTAGAITPTTNGDVIFQMCGPSTFWENGATSAPVFGDSGVALFGPDNFYQVGGEAFVQTTAAAITPYLQLTGQSLDAVCVSIAYKTSAGAGTAPSGAQVISSTSNFGNTATEILEATVFNSGDTLAVVGNAGALGTTVVNCSGISDSLGNTWTIKQNAGGSANIPMFAFDSNSTAGLDYITLTGCRVGGNYIFTVVEMSGLKNSSHTGSYDSTMGICQGSGGASPYSSAPGSCSPSTSNGIMIALMEDGVGPATAISSPSGGTYNFPVYTGMTDISEMTQGGGLSFLYNTGTGPYSWTWTNANSSSWTASALAFEAAPSSGVVRHRAWVIQ